MADFVIVPRGPFSLARAADVVGHFPPLRHQPPASDRVVRLGFIADRDHRPVAVSLRKEAWGNVLHGTVAGTTNIEAVRRQVARIFALDYDGTTFPEIAKRDPNVAPVMKEFEGLRPVSFTSPYECACWAIISQRISTTQAANVVAKLIRGYGETLVVEDEPIAIFPRPERLLEATTIAGLATAKVERLHGIARAALEGRLDAETLRKLSEADALEALLELPGIGPFWANGIRLRACGVADCFPDEPISIAAVGALHGLGDHPAPEALAKIVERYRPFGMWVAFLLRVAAARGALGDISGREMAIRRSSGRARSASRPASRLESQRLFTA